MTVALQKEGAGRAMAQFAMDSTLKQVVDQLCKEKPSPTASVVPVIILSTNAEIRGEEALSSTTLSGLGFTASRRELLKLKYVDVEKEKEVKEENEALGQANKIVTEPGEKEDSPPRRAMRVDDGESMLKKLVGDHHENAAQAGLNIRPAEEQQQEEAMEVDQSSSSQSANVAAAANDVALYEDDADVEEEPDTTTPEIHYLSEANKAIVYHADDLKALIAKKKPTDAFFDHTVEDVKKRQRDLKAEADRLAEGGVLAVKSYKDEQAEANKLNQLHKYKNTVIRVQFPDRYVLQGVFLSGAKVSEIGDFVKTHLQDPTKDFELFTTPPKTVLDPAKTLLDSLLVPMSVVYFGPKGGDGNSTEKYLKQEVVEKKSNAKGVVQATEESEVKRKHGGGAQN